MAEENKTEEFKAPQELGVTEDEFCALMKVAEGLQDGTMVHTTTADQIKEAVVAGKKPFNMGHWRNKLDCGTVCCIGGLAGFHEDDIRVRTTVRSDGVRMRKYRDLFYPPGRDWANIQPAHAAKAIINWAKTGDPQWNKVMGQK